MSYEPKAGHVVTFVNTHDNKTRYHVDHASDSRLRLSPVDQSSDYYEVEVDLSRELAAEMGVSPAVLTDAEMGALKAAYAVILLEAMDVVETATLIATLFGSDVAAKMLTGLATGIENIREGIQFCEDARNGVYV